jgi:hypothetical protein
VRACCIYSQIERLKLCNALAEIRKHYNTSVRFATNNGNLKGVISVHNIVILINLGCLDWGVLVIYTKYQNFDNFDSTLTTN